MKKASMPDDITEPLSVSHIDPEFLYHETEKEKKFLFKLLYSRFFSQANGRMDL